MKLNQASVQHILYTYMSYFAFNSLNHYVLFHLKDNFFFIYFFSPNFRFDIFIPKLLIYYFVIYSHSEKINLYNISFTCKHVFYKRDTIKFTHKRTIILYSKYIVSNWFIWFCLILLDKYVQFQKNRSIQLDFCQWIIKFNVLLYSFSSLKFIPYVSSFILGKLFILKTLLNLFL